MTDGAILLAGGRATRMGGIDKPLVAVGGRSLLQRAVDAVRGCDPIVIAGPDSPVERALPLWVREDPPFSGPAAAIVAALDSIDTAWVFVLACDLPYAEQVVAGLSAARATLPADTDGVCLTDASGRTQWLSGLYRTAGLQAAASLLPDRGRDASVRALLDGLAIATVSAPDAARDIDTWDDLRRIEEDE